MIGRKTDYNQSVGNEADPDSTSFYSLWNFVIIEKYVMQ